jgi:hypothetical protein
VGEIKQFPGIAENAWLKDRKKFEEAIRVRLSSEGHPEEAVDEICARMRSHYEELRGLAEFKYQSTFGSPGDFSEKQVQVVQNLVAGLEKKFQKHVHKLLRDALTRIGRLEVAFSLQARGIDFSW